MERYNKLARNLSALLTAVAATVHLSGCDQVRGQFERMAEDHGVNIVIPPGYLVTAARTKAVISGYDKCPDAPDRNCIVVGPKQEEVKVLVNGSLIEKWRIVRTDLQSGRGRTFVRPNGDQVYYAN